MCKFAGLLTDALQCPWLNPDYHPLVPQTLCSALQIDLDTNSEEQKKSTRVEHKSRAKMNLQILNVRLTFLQSQNEHLWVDLKIQQMSKWPMTQGKKFKSYITISNKMRKQLGVAFQIGTQLLRVNPFLPNWHFCGF